MFDTCSPGGPCWMTEVVFRPTAGDFQSKPRDAVVYRFARSSDDCTNGLEAG
jgi:hypothetical protein